MARLTHGVTRGLVPLTLTLALALAAPARGDDAPVSPALVEGEDVKVEATKPERPKLATLRFLHANRDFLRMRLDALRQRELERKSAAEALDPRFLAYDAMKKDIAAAEDSIAAAAEARRRQELYADVTDLGALDAELDGLELRLADQRARLGVLEADFLGRQATALLVVVTGAPAAGGPAALSIATEDGTVHRVPFSAADLDALHRGGATQVLHVFVEPRAQTLALALADPAGAPGPTAWVTLDPPRDRITFLALDLAPVAGSLDATRLTARAWQHGPDTLPTTR